MKTPYIVIEGNIGAGKTTFAKALAERLQANLLLEEFENNEALKDFYASQNNQQKNPFALATEMQFLINRYRQQQQFFMSHSAQEQVIVSDYLPQKSLLFAEMNLNPSQFEVYASVFDTFMNELPLPNLVVYLSCKPDVLLSNIQKRGREYEQQIALPYLEKIENNYIQLLKKLPTTIPILTFTETDQYQTNQQDVLTKIVETINKAY